MRASIHFLGKPYPDEVEVDATHFQIFINDKCYPLDQQTLAAPVSGTIYGTMFNYKGTLAALGETVYHEPYKSPPIAPVLYIKPINTVIGYGMPIPLPSGVVELETGAALGVVIGQTATCINENNAMEYVAGYTVVNDISIPHASYYRPAIKQKARDGFCPVGPWVVPRDAIANPASLSLHVYINDELRQEDSTRNLVRSIPRLLTEITEFMTLYPGDLLITGFPNGAPLVKAGDRIRIEIEQVGKLENTVVPEDILMLGGTL